MASVHWLALAWVTAGVLLLSAGPGRAGWPADADLVVTLEDAIARPEAPQQRKPLRLRLQRVGGVWHPLVVADTRVTGDVYNHGDHHGCVTATSQREPPTVLDVCLRIESDPWSDTAGYARYRVALRARTQTPAGQRDLERLRQQAHGRGSATDRAVALGLLYQIEGDVAHAQAARDLLRGDIGNWGNVHHVHGAAALFREAKANGDGFAAENTLVQNNTMIDCGGADTPSVTPTPCAGTMVGNDLPQRIGANEVHGAGRSTVHIRGDCD